MAKDSYEELRNGLTEMAKEELLKAVDAIESDTLPEIPMRTSQVMRKVYEIARHHKMTADEFALILSVQDTASTAERAAMMEEYKKYLEEA